MIAAIVESVPKYAWGWLSVFIGLIAFIVYIYKTVLRKHVQPHPLSWLIWGLVTGIATTVQWLKGAGAGAWVTALTTVFCVIMWHLARIKSQLQRELDANRDVVWWLNRLSLTLSMVAAIWFGVVKDATTAAILVTLADLLGYIPTVSKGWNRPRSDSATAFLFNSGKFIPAYLALSTKSVATALYPVALAVANFGVFLMLVSRRAATRKA